MTNQNQIDVTVPKEQEKLLTVQQAAKALGIPYRPLLAAFNAKQIPCYRIGKSRRLVLPSEILAFMRLNISIKETEHVQQQS